MKSYNIKSFLAVALLAVVSVWAADAQAARAPKVKLLGKLSEGAPATVTIEALEKLPLTTFETYNPFAKTVNSYTGVLLRDLAKAYGATGIDNMVVTAVDGYETNFVKEEWGKYNVLLATRVDGKHIEVKDSGPAKIIIDYDRLEEGLKRRYNRKWIWLITSVEFKTGGVAFEEK